MGGWGEKEVPLREQSCVSFILYTREGSQPAGSKHMPRSRATRLRPAQAATPGSGHRSQPGDKAPSARGGARRPPACPAPRRHEAWPARPARSRGVRRRSGGVGGSGRHGAGSWRRRSPATEAPSILCAEESEPHPPPPATTPPQPGGRGGEPRPRDPRRGAAAGPGGHPRPTGARRRQRRGGAEWPLLASPAPAAAHRTWLLPPFPSLCVSAPATLAHTLSHCSRGRAGGRRGKVGGCGGVGGPARFQRPPEPRQNGQSPGGDPCSLPCPAD